MIEYAKLKRDRRKLLALTGLTLTEFRALRPAFEKAYRQHYAQDKTLADRKRKRQWGGGRRGVLETPEQKLLFILVYQKTYPLQVVMGELFSLSQPSANQWLQRLWPILRSALAALGVKPERAGHKLAQAERGSTEPHEYLIDGTERQRQRPKPPEKQAQPYSGKTKAHSDKTLVRVTRRTKRVGYLSPTYAGKIHDKKLADQERIAYPRRARLHKDTGFQGYEPPGTQTFQPKKSRVGAR
jgi:Helix-turn-helix of DDE superfamily endonuclease/DDE superfamily endonuclease